MKVVVTGATGNVGTALMPLLAADQRIDEIVAVARRHPGSGFEAAHRCTAVAADVAADDLRPLVAGADVVVHLAWLIQPSRQPEELWRANVVGSQRVIDAVLDEGVPRLLHASSIAAYAPAPKAHAVDESAPLGGVPTLPYAQQKVEVERRLDAALDRRPELQVLRFRPSIILQPGAATGIRRLFAGPFLPNPVLPPGRVVAAIAQRVAPRLQVVHSHDVAAAFHLGVHSSLTGAVNLAAEPPLGPAGVNLAGLRAVRPLHRAAWLARLVPAEPGWLDFALAAPVMATDRARSELGWSPTLPAAQVLARFVDGLRAGDDAPTPPLASSTSGPARSAEVLTGVGQRST